MQNGDKFVAMEFKLLGPLDVVADGRSLQLGGRKQRAVLAMLVLEPNRVVSVDRLVDRLWGEDAPPGALGSLHVYISNLRRALEPGRPARTAAQVLVSRAPGYMLVAPPQNVDALLFEQLAAEGRQLLRDGRAEEAVRMLRSAMGLWRGPVLAEFEYEDFVTPAAQRLDELRRNVAEDLVEARMATGENVTVIADLEELVEADPLRERSWGQLMIALYRSGRQADALRAYQRARSVLADELGLDPGPELEHLEHAVLRHDRSLDAGAGRTSSSAAAAAGPLTAELDSAVLLGREPQLERIEAMLEALAAGRGTVLVVSGESGVGKSALLAELARRARARGLPVGCGQSHECGPTPPLRTWADALGALLPDRTLFDTIALECENMATLSPAKVTRQFERTLAALRQLTADRPTVIVLDDLQWADELSHQFLRLLIREVTGRGLLVALGVREPVEESSSELIATRASLARIPDLQRLSLAGLDRSAVAALAELLADDTPAADVLIAIHDRTAGNPFFVTELVRLLASEHALHDVGRMVGAGVPVGARDVVRRRLARLPEQAVGALGVAAVIGQQVDARLITSMTGIDIDTIVDLFDLATVASVIAEHDEQPGIYEFTHDIVREAIYGALPGLRRARLHQRAAAGLLELRGDVPAVAHEVARHAVLATPAAGPEQAVPRLLTSARVAHRQLSVELAERQLRRGLTLLAELPEGPDGRLMEALFGSRLAQISFYIRGNAAEAAARLRRARELCPRGEVETLLAILIGEAAVSGLWGDIARSLAAADEAVALARDVGSRQAESDGEYCRCYLLWTGPPDCAQPSIDRSIELAESIEATQGPPTGFHVPVASKRAMRSVAMVLKGDTEGAREEGRSAVAVAAGDADAWALSWAGAFVMLAASVARDSEEVLRLWEEVADAAAGLPYTDAVIEACRAWAAGQLSPQTGRSDLRAARDRLATVGDGLMQVPLAILEAELLVSLGLLQAAADALEEAGRLAESGGQRAWLPEIERVAAANALARNDVAEASRLLSSALARAEELGLELFAARARADHVSLG
jgi:DNA-binding SARP family transcriptional activator